MSDNQNECLEPPEQSPPQAVLYLTQKELSEQVQQIDEYFRKEKELPVRLPAPFFNKKHEIK